MLTSELTGTCFYNSQCIKFYSISYIKTPCQRVSSNFDKHRNRFIFLEIVNNNRTHGLMLMFSLFAGHPSSGYRLLKTSFKFLFD